MIKRFTIIRIRKIPSQDVNQELQWLGNALGLFNLRDKDKSCFRLFIELLKAAKMRVPLSSDELALNIFKNSELSVYLKFFSILLPITVISNVYL